MDDQFPSALAENLKTAAPSGLKNFFEYQHPGAFAFASLRRNKHAPG
jgi:hypothetical protein